jgi:glyoxylase-like metal-dependent hydrolase (beta-lactamase superfamily II)
MERRTREGPRYPFDRLPEAGGTIEVAPGIHWVRMPLPFALDHINLWLLEDEGAWTAVDTGYALPEVERRWETLFRDRLGAAPLARVLVTHFHPDHLGLAAWLEERCEAALWMTAEEWRTAHRVHAEKSGLDPDSQNRFYHRHGASQEQLAALAARRGSYRKGVPKLPRQYRHLREDEAIRIGKREWRVIVGAGHSPEHACLYNEETGVLISGDQILPRITTNVSVYPTAPAADPLRDYLDSLEKFRAIPESTLVLPSHGKPFIGLNSRIKELRAHHQARLADLLKACDSPRSAAELLPVLFLRGLDSHQLFFAFGEAIAHLHYLAGKGKLADETGNDGVLRYRRT